MNEIDQVNALVSGKGVQFLLDSAYQIFSCPIYVVDSLYNLIAFSGVPSAEYPVWHELLKTGTFNASGMEEMKSENLLRDLYYSGKIMRISSNIWPHNLISGHLYNADKNWIGQTTIAEFVPLDTEGMAAFEMLVDKISSEIGNYEYFIKQPTILFKKAINKLLDVTIKNTRLNNAPAEIINYSFEHYLYVAVVSVSRNNYPESIRQSRLAYFMSMLKTKYHNFKYAIYEDQIVVLMGAKDKDFYELSFFAPNKDLFEENGLCLGVSHSFEDIYDTRRYYDQAVAALKKGIESGVGERVFLYNGAESIY